MNTNLNVTNINYNNDDQFVTVGPQVMANDFGAFILRTANNDINGHFVISDRDAFFKAESYYNPLKHLATVVNTNADIVEMPAFNPVCSGWDSDDIRQDEGENVTIKLYHAYAKFMVSRNMFNKIQACESYIKNVLSMKLASLEKKASFIGNGDKSPEGIISQYKKHFNNQILNIESAKLDEGLCEMKAKLDSSYYANATFIVSSLTFQKLIKLNKAQNSMLFDKLDTLYGHKVIVMDEVEDNIILADFKQAVVIVEGEENIVKMHSSYERPNMIGISMPISMGISILNYDAIVCAKVC